MRLITLLEARDRDVRAESSIGFHRPVRALLHAGDDDLAGRDRFIAASDGGRERDGARLISVTRTVTSNSCSKRSARWKSNVAVDARPADVAVGRVDAEPGLAPERVLGFLHVAEEPAEMHDAGRVGLVELDAAFQTVLSQGSLVLMVLGVLRFWFSRFQVQVLENSNSRTENP